MICVPSNPRLPYLWKRACFSSGEQSAGDGAAKGTGPTRGRGGQQGTRAVTVTCIRISGKSCNQMVVSISAGILARNESWLVLGWEICTGVVIQLQFSWVALSPVLVWVLVTAVNAPLTEWGLLVISGFGGMRLLGSPCYNADPWAVGLCCSH